MNRVVTLIVVIVLLFVLKGAFFVVDQTEQAVIVQLGRPVRSVTESGLHFKIPIIQNVRIFDKRILEWDGRPKSLTTIDKVSIYIDTTARWRITNPLMFLQSVEGNELIAQSRLDNFIEGAVKDFIANNALIELVRSTDRPMISTGVDEKGKEVRAQLEMPPVLVGRNSLARNILERAKNDAVSLGIDLVDVRIKGVNYVERVREKVYERMIAERMQRAAQFRSLGDGEKSRILGDKEIQLKTIISAADRESLEIRGKADAEVTAIFAKAFNRDPEFYSYVKTLETYKTTLSQNTSLILGMNSEFLKYLKNSSGR